MAVPICKASLSFVVWLGIGVMAVAGEPGSIAAAQTSALNLLSVGFESRIVPVDELERAYQSELAHLPGGSPYLEYAFALVLSRNLQPKQAVTHLQAAARSRSPVLLPAHEELIRRGIAASDYQPALEMLAEYACLIDELSSDSGDTTEARRAAGWLGGMVAYLEGPANAPDEIEELSKLTGSQLKLLLDRRFVKDYETGRQAVKDLQADLEKQVDEATTQSTSKQLDDQKELETRKEQVEQRTATIRETSTSAQKTMREQLGDVDGKIKLLEKQFNFSLEAEQRLIASQVILQAEIRRLKQQQNVNQNSNDRFVNNGFLPRAGQIGEQIAAAEVQYALSINQHVILLQSRFELMQHAKSLLLIRQGLAQKAGMTAVQTQSQLELMKRWENRLEAEGKKQDKAKTSESSSVARIRRRMSDLATYDQISLEQRRETFTNLLKQATAADDK